MPRRACANAQTHQSLRCLHAQSMDVDEVSDQNFKRDLHAFAISTKISPADPSICSRPPDVFFLFLNPNLCQTVLCNVHWYLSHARHVLGEQRRLRLDTENQSFSHTHTNYRLLHCPTYETTYEVSVAVYTNYKRIARDQKYSHNV